MDRVRRPRSGTQNPAETQLCKQLAACDQRLTENRAALNAGADAVQVAKWINETEQEPQRVEGELRAVPTDQAVSPDVVAELLRRAGDLADAVVRARPDDKADLYTKLGLTMTYYPEKKLVEARVAPASTCADGLCPRTDQARPPK
jgi:hypothetical protein